MAEDPAWVRAQSSMRKIWDETPDGARAITRMLDAVAELRSAYDFERTLSQRFNMPPELASTCFATGHHTQR